MNKKKAAWIIIFVLVMLGSTFVPTGYDVLFAGEPVGLNEYVLYEDGFEVDGELAMTYVSSLENVEWPFLLIGMMVEEGVDVEPAISVSLDMDTEDLFSQALMMMDQSKIKAEYIAKEYLGEELQLDIIGFYPVHYVPDWPYKDAIKVSDLIVEIDGVKLEDFHQMDNLILAKEPNEKVVLTVLREEELTEVEVRTYPERDYYHNTILGVYLEQVYQIEEDERIKLNIENVGGPSAGLMLTLTLLEKMTEESLLKGNKVAGTGTMEMTGEVGHIGGVKQKIIGAELGGYDYFLVPEDNELGNNEEIARRTVEEEGLSIKILPIGTLADAVEALRSLPEKK